MEVSPVSCAHITNSKDLRVEDPALNLGPSLVALVGSLGPVALDLLQEAVLALLSALLDLVAFGHNVVLELVGVPLAVWLDHVVVPVLLHKVLKILAVRSSWVWNVVIREPTLELSLVPFVICYTA